MLKNRQQQVDYLVRATDVVVCAVAFLIAYEARMRLPWFAPEVDSIQAHLWLLMASLAIHFFIFQNFGFYESLRRKTVMNIVVMVLKAAVVELFVLGALVFFFQAKSTSRAVFGLFIAINYTLLLFEKLGARVVLSNLRKRGFNYRQILIVGTGESARQTVLALQRNRHWGYVCHGALSEDGSIGIKDVCGVPVVGRQSELEAVIQRQPTDEVYFALDRFESQALSHQVALCERLGIPSRFALNLFQLPTYRTTFGMLDHIPIVTFYVHLMTPVEALLKRTMDIAGAMVGLVVTGLFFPWIAWRIHRESPGPVVFKQIRIGENGRHFKCYKFRTMALDAESRKAELAEANQMQGPIFKVDNDPRVFPFGAFLRRTSLDELPQFLNILRGDMSLVGTRPPTPDEVERYEIQYRRRLSVRPGLTGLWQVSGRNRITNFEDVVALDNQYIECWSLWLDLKIIMKTLWTVLGRRGAY